MRPPTQEEIDRFKVTVWTMRTTRLPGDHESNRFRWHSQIVSEQLLEFAFENQLDIRVMKGLGTASFYGEFYADLIIQALKKNVNVEILFAEPLEGEEERLWSKVRAEAPAEHLSIRYLPKYDAQFHHHLLCGTAAYRLEFPHDRNDGTIDQTSPERPARFSFSDESLGKTILKYHNFMRQFTKSV